MSRVNRLLFIEKQVRRIYSHFSSVLSRMATVSSLRVTVVRLRMSVRMPGNRGDDTRRPSYVYTYTLELSTTRKCLHK